MNITDITAAEAARRLGVSREIASRLAQAGKFPGARKPEWSSNWSIPEEDVEALRREREQVSTETD